MVSVETGSQVRARNAGSATKGRTTFQTLGTSPGGLVTNGADFFSLVLHCKEVLHRFLGSLWENISSLRERIYTRSYFCCFPSLQRPAA